MGCFFNSCIIIVLIKALDLIVSAIKSCHPLDINIDVIHSLKTHIIFIGASVVKIFGEQKKKHKSINYESKTCLAEKKSSGKCRKCRLDNIFFEQQYDFFAWSCGIYLLYRINFFKGYTEKDVINKAHCIYCWHSWTPQNWHNSVEVGNIQGKWYTPTVNNINLLAEVSLKSNAGMTLYVLSSYLVEY